MFAPSKSPLRIVLGYALAIGSAALATLITRLIRPFLGESISPLFFAAVMLSTWYGGLGPGLLATALAAWATTYLFINPPGTVGIGWDDIIRLAVFLMVALLISYLTFLRKRAEEALRRSYDQLEDRVQQRTAELQASNRLVRDSQERFRLLVEGVADYAIVMLDAAGQVVSWNSGAERIMGYTYDQIIGQHFSCFFTHEDIQRSKPREHLSLATGQQRIEEEGWRVRKDASRFWANVITTSLRDESGALRGFAQVTRDITELRGLERQVLEIAEKEQRRIGHDLHDGLGQELTGLAFLCRNLARKLSTKSAPEAAEADRIVSLANQAIEQTREVARGFSPVEVGPDGLRAALEDLARKAHHLFDLPCRAQCATDVRVHDDAAALHMYRIAQEAVSNTVRHGKAHSIRIFLSASGPDVTLRVEDDGIGLPPASERGKGLGISLMQYRARMFGGSLQVQNGPGGGTVVSCTYTNPVPLSTVQTNDDKTTNQDASGAVANPAGR